MSIMGGGNKDQKDKVVKPPPGMMRDSRPVYHGNPQNMDTSTFRYATSPQMFIPKSLGGTMGATKDKKNSLISGRMK